VARDPRFREAVTWQNRAALRNAIDAVAAGRAGASSDGRRRWQDRGELLAALLRQQRDAAGTGGCWLQDAAGHRYTSKLRVVAVDLTCWAAPIDASPGPSLIA
jgi:hypothetical protein